MKIYSEELKKIKLIDVFEIVLSGEWGEENLEDNENTAYIIRTTNFLNDGTLDVENRELVKRKISREKIDEKHLKRGDIIIEKSGGSPNQPVGRVIYFDIESEKNFLCNNFTSILRVKEGIEPKYIFYFLKDCYKKRIVLKYQNKTTGIINLKLQDYLKNTEIQLPNIEIQKKIVEILDKAFLINSLLIEKERRISELNKCLFIKMFGDPILNEKNWKEDICKNITLKIGSGSTPKGGEKNYKIEGIAFIRSMNVYNNKFNYKDLVFIDEIQSKILQNVEVKKEDILLNITGASVARCCIVPENILPARVNQHVSIIRCKENIINSIFLCYQFTTKEYQDFLWKLSTSNGATREALTKQQEENLKVIVPPIELQNQFAERIKIIEKSKIEIQKSIEETKKLFDSLMEKYFG